MSLTQLEREYDMYCRYWASKKVDPVPIDQFDLLWWMHSAEREAWLLSPGAVDLKATTSARLGANIVEAKNKEIGDDPAEALKKATQNAMKDFVRACYNGTDRPKTLAEMTDDERKALPVFTGVMEYFPDALLEVAAVSKSGNDQHNPGQPLHWAKEKSQDQLNTAMRHALQHGTRDKDGRRHMAKACWRFLAELQLEIDADRAGMSRKEYDEYLREIAAAKAKETQ